MNRPILGICPKIKWGRHLESARYGLGFGHFAQIVSEESGFQQRLGVSTGQRLESGGQFVFLRREHGSQVEDQLFVLNAGDNGRVRGA
jgi:hypothetical protein